MPLSSAAVSSRAAEAASVSPSHSTAEARGKLSPTNRSTCSGRCRSDALHPHSISTSAVKSPKRHILCRLAMVSTLRCV